MIKNISLSIIILTLFSCSKDDTIFKQLPNDGFISLHITDQNGIDLLDPYIDNTLNIGALGILYLKSNGELDERLAGERRRYSIFEMESYGYVMSLELDRYRGSNFTETLIKWKDNSMDTIKVEYSITEGNYVFVDNVWYNDTKTEATYQHIVREIVK